MIVGLSLLAVGAPVADNCLFLHGLGVAGNVTDAFFLGVAYWLELKSKAKELCNHTHYPIYDTVTRGAGNVSLQNDFFNEAAKYQGPNDRVFAHSMGNVILAKACTDQKKCLARGWFAAHGPITGSVFPNLLKEWCPPSGSGIPGQLAGWAADLVGYCSVATYSLMTCDQPGSQSVCGGAAQLAVVGRMMRHGTMCGTSGWGITSLLSPLLGALDDLFLAPRDAAPDDGMVSLSSCTSAFDAWVNATGSNATFGAVPSGRFYRAETNHGDGMGFAGDGGDDNQKPVTWYENMIRMGWQA